MGVVEGECKGMLSVRECVRVNAKRRLCKVRIYVRKWMKVNVKMRGEGACG